MLKFKSRRAKGLTIELTPLVDMVFLLLIFFLLSSSFLQPNIKLELPSGKNADVARRKEIIISVDANRNVYVNLEKVTLKALGGTLENKMEETGTRAVTFRGDRQIPYELFVKIADTAKRAGAEDINISHRIESEE